MTADYRDFYRGRKVMVTGGLGFIGSNLARRLVELGADVLLVDSLVPEHGGNLFNIDGVADRLQVNVADLRQPSTMNYLVRDRAVIFNLAGQVSHIDSMRDPYSDLDINCRSQLTVLEACRNHNPAVKVVFAGTRQVYGRPAVLPVSEAHLVRLTDVNGINKAAGEDYHLVYNNVFGVRACSLRLTNVYGPRQLIKHNRQGFIAWFIRLAIEDKPIRIYGDGSQVRDFVYVDDAADAFLRAGAKRCVQRQGIQRGRRRTDQPPPTGGAARRARQVGSRAVRRVAGRAESDRHRQLLRRLDEIQTDDRLGARAVASRWARADDRVLPAALRSLRRPGRPACGARVTRLRIPFMSMALADDAVAVRSAIDRVIARGWFVLGPEVEAFEAEFAAAMGASHAIGVGTGTGTDALMLTLRALGIGPGDEVITTPLSAAYTALAVMMAGARPVFADIDPVRFTIDPEQVERAIGPRTRAILPVHLYGQAADMAAIETLAAHHHLALVEDCCQAHLATAGGRPVGTIGVAGAFSFYPTKNLGALGDGGAVVTNDGKLAERIKRLRNGGQADRSRHQEAGVNSRLDEIQAAILRARLPWLRQWTARRRVLAAAYRAALTNTLVELPQERDGGHVYHLFVVRTPA